MKHMFVICAYKESEYLEECIISLKKQTEKSEIIMVTSTPSDFLKKMAEKYGINYYVNTGEAGITQDWNYAYKMAEADVVTIAHQDDVYLPDYSKMIMQGLRKAKHPLIAFTGYGELRNGKVVKNNKLLKVKKTMLSPLKVRWLQKSRFVRRRILAFGCPICCPAVSFVKENLPEKIFTAGFRSDEDWEAWEKLSRRKGEFVYLETVQMLHRIHEESETTAIIGDNVRNKEDYIMYKKFWPTPIAKVLARLYSKSEDSNKL